jgi:RNA polymerase sigma-70 factor (ECF subfamily)
MLGSVASAEDVLAEAYLRFDRAARAAAAGEGASIESPKAYLSAVVTRLAIDELKSARVRRETYSGIWLPEPVLTDTDSPLLRPTTGPAAHAEAAETLSMAFLLVLDRLNPVERAVFLLHDVFGYDFAEIEPIVDRTEVNCRQIAARARKRVRADRPRLDTDAGRREEVANKLLAAMTSGDMDALVGLLKHDVAVMGDGGGNAPQWAVPIVGIERVAKLLLGLARQLAAHKLTPEPHSINGQPGLVIRTETGQITNIFEIEIVDGQLQTLRGVTNPDKLRHLGPVADVYALARTSPPNHSDL